MFLCLFLLLIYPRRKSVISNSVAVHQRRASKGSELPAIMIITILHVRHPLKRNTKYQCNTFTNVNKSWRWIRRCPTAETTSDTGWDLSPPEELRPSSHFSRRHIHYPLTRCWLTGWLADFMLMQWNNPILFSLSFIFFYLAAPQRLLTCYLFAKGTEFLGILQCYLVKCLSPSALQKKIN